MTESAAKEFVKHTKVPTEDYLQSIFKIENFINLPRNQNDYLLTATKLLERRNIVRETDQALASQKDEFQMKIETLNQRSRELEKKENQFKEQFSKFDRFIQDNDAKKTRAVKKLKEEEILIEKHKDRFEDLKKEFMELNKVRDGLQEKVNKYSVYKSYLDSVLLKSDYFQEIKEMVDRYRTLKSLLGDLHDRDLISQTIGEDQRKQFDSLKSVSSRQKLMFNRNLGNLLSNIEKQRILVQKWQSESDRISNKIHREIYEYGVIKCVIYNIYMIIRTYQKLPISLPQKAFHAQLSIINTFIRDMQSIIDREFDRFNHEEMTIFKNTET